MTEYSLPRRCTECGEPQRQERRTIDYPESGLSNVQLVNVPVWVCANHHEEIEIPAVTQLHELLAQMILRKPAALGAAEIKFLRRRVGIPAKEFARKIGLTPVALSRFENGKRDPTPRLDLLIRLSTATMIARRDRTTFPADLVPLLDALEAWDIGSHRIRHVDAAPPNHEWETDDIVPVQRELTPVR